MQADEFSGHKIIVGILCGKNSGNCIHHLRAQSDCTQGSAEQSSGHGPHGIIGRCIHFKPVSPSLKPEVIGYCQRPVTAT